MSGQAILFLDWCATDLLRMYRRSWCVHVSVITVSGLPPIYVLDFPSTSSFGFLKKLAIQSLFVQIFCRYVRFKDLLIEKNRNFKGNQVISSCNLRI